MTKLMYGPLCLGLATCLLSVWGCSTGHKAAADQELFQVSGQVTVAGKPLERLIVLFLPLHEGSRSRGITDRNGRYALLNESELPGISAGEYRVIFQPVRLPSDTKEHSSQVDAVYQAFETTPVEVMVSADANRMNFDLQLPPSN